MRKLSFSLTLIFLLTLLAPAEASAVSFVPPETVYSEAVYMVNLDITDENGCGTVVFKQNENKLMSPASLTKIMTALLVLEHFEGDEQALKTTYVSAPSTAFDELYLQNASTADFRIDELANYSDLLYGLMLQSACEAANIIAYNLGNDNSMADFVRQMNEKAAELGATNTHFTNAHGLYSESQRTSARDMAIITQYAINKYPILLEIASTQNYDLEATNKHSSPRTVVNTNYMMSPTNGGELYYYPYVKGIKTGTLDEAGRCLITTAEKDGFHYLLVTLNAPLRDAEGTSIFYNFLDHKTLYNWAFSKLSYEKILTSGEEVAEVKVEYGDDAGYVLLRASGEFSCLWSSDVNMQEIQRVVTKESSVMAPVEKGVTLGTLELKLRGETIASVELVTASAVKRDELAYKLAVAKLFPESKLFKRAVFISLGIIMLYTALFIAVCAKKASRRRRRPSVNRKIR